MPVPGSLESGSGEKLVALIGQHAARALIEYAGGDTLYISAGWERVLGARYAEIKAMRARGMSYAEIARKFEYTGRYSERNIRMILAGERDDVITAMKEFEQLLLSV
jgi:Mor family transcriptional regulator